MRRNPRKSGKIRSTVGAAELDISDGVFGLTFRFLLKGPSLSLLVLHLIHSKSYFIELCQFQCISLSCCGTPEDSLAH